MGYQGFAGVKPESVKRGLKKDVDMSFGGSKTAGKAKWKGYGDTRPKCNDNMLGQSDVKVGSVKDTKVRSSKFGSGS